MAAVADPAAHGAAEFRIGTALIVDIAGTVSLRMQLGDAAASRRIGSLLEKMVAAARGCGGIFVKSYGDDVLTIFEQEASAARAAIAAQQLASEAGFQLYAGFHRGQLEFRQTMGHLDVTGLTVNIAERLHKLTEGAPGRIFLAEESLQALPDELRCLTHRYGVRELKGMGRFCIWTLDWQEAQTTTTVSGQEAYGALPQAALLLRHGHIDLALPAERKSLLAGRGKECLLRIPDPQQRVSSNHLLFEFVAGRWFVQDISRNGTWMRDAGTGEASRLPNCRQAMLPRSGALCLGRPFAEDAEGRFTLGFVIGGP